MKVFIGKLFKRVNLLALSLILATSGMSAAVPLFLSQNANAEAPTSVNISNVADLCNAIKNQADNQIWTINNTGAYGLTQCNNISAGGQTGWYFPITANNITINGFNNPTIYGTGFTANGDWASQDLIAIFGNNVTINGLTLMPKVEPNKTIEVMGDSATIKNITITPNTLTDQNEYNNISDPSDLAWTQYAKTFGGSIYYNNATGTQTLNNVSINNGGVSVHAPGATFNVSSLHLSYTSNVDWINDYRFYVASQNNVINSIPTYMYHVNGTLNNFDSVLAAVGDTTTVVGTDTISLDSNLTTIKQVTLTKPVTLNGNGHTINPTFLKTNNSNNSALGILGDNITVNNLIEDGTGSTNLHGINAYMANGINLNDVTVKNNGYDGLAVNGSDVTVNNLTTSGNGWGGVDVDQGSGVTTPAVLTVTGHSAQTESGADILVDNINNPKVTVNDPSNQYSYATYGIMGVYKLKLATPINLTPVDGTYTNNPAFVNTWSNVADATGYEYRTANTMNGNVLGPIIYSDSNLTQPGRYSTSGSTETRQNGGAPQDTYYWQVRATGANGKVSDWSQINKVVVDTTAPSMPTLTTPSNNGFETTNNFYFTWSNSTDIGTPVTYEFQSDNNGSFTSPWDSITNGNSEQNNLTTPQIHSTGAPDGTYYWRVRALDAAGNESAWTTPWKMTIDSMKPVMTITSPTANQVIKGRSVAISGTAIDSNFNYYYCYVSNVNGHEYGYRDASCNTTWHAVTSNGLLGTITLPNDLSDGNYVVHLIGKDKAGNTTETTQPFMLDNTRPSLSFTAPADLSTPFKTGPIVSVHGSDANGLSVLNIHVYNNSNVLQTKSCTATSAELASGNLSCDLSGLADGTYYIKVGENDKAGNNQTITSAHFIIDSIAPVGGSLTMKTKLFPAGLTVTSPTAGVYTLPDLSMDGADVFDSLSVAVTDANMDTTAKPAVSVDGTINGYMEYNTSTGVWDYAGQTSTPTFAPGTHNLVATFFDLAGNSTMITARFTTDNTAPVVTIDASANTANNKPTITGTVDDRSAKVSLDIDGTSFVATNNGNGTWAYTMTAALTDGTHTLTATGTDTAGNTTTPVATGSILVDTTGPVVTIADITAPITTGSVTPTVTAVDVSVPLTYLWTADPANHAVLNFTNNVAEPTFMPTVAGTYNFKLLITDALGNQTTKTFGFTYTLPVVTTNGTTPSVIAVTPQTTNNNLGTPAVLGVQTIAANTDTTQTPTADVLGTPDVKGASTQLATTTTPSSSSTGLAWYWWVLIVAAVVSFVWWLIARLRNRANVA